jgi:hypothetical protein
MRNSFVRTFAFSNESEITQHTPCYNSDISLLKHATYEYYSCGDPDQSSTVVHFWLIEHRSKVRCEIGRAEKQSFESTGHHRQSHIACSAQHRAVGLIILFQSTYPVQAAMGMLFKFKCLPFNG